MKKKTILSWFRKFLKNHADDFDGLPEAPADDIVEKLINRAVTHKNELQDGKIPESAGIPQEAPADSQETDQVAQQKECCPYSVKRNIVASIEEVRTFARQHKLAASMVKALLSILAELAANALKGKVSASALLMLLNAMNFDKAREEAYKEGEIAGKNAKIEEEYFPAVDDGIPHFTGSSPKTPNSDDIFTLARKA